MKIVVVLLLLLISGCRVGDCLDSTFGSCYLKYANRKAEREIRRERGHVIIIDGEEEGVPVEREE